MEEQAIAYQKNKDVVNEKQAAAEVSAWLDFHCVSTNERLAFSLHVEKITLAMQRGYVTIDPKTFEVKQKLMFPFGAEAKLDELVFKTSSTVQDTCNATEIPEGEKENDYSKSVSIITNLTGANRALIYRMNRKDFKISDAIALFLML